MRDIKFRGLDIKTGKMVFGGGIDSQRDTPIIINHGERYFVDAKTVGQYTGLKDKNGVDIYEGDIVKWGHIDGFIEMSGARVAVVDMSNSCDGLTFDAFKPIAHRFKIGNFMYRNHTEKRMEVIGNIHQKPELREGKK